VEAGLPTQRSILDIALDSGYEGREAFARAFKQRLGQTPSEFRNQPQWPSWRAAFQPISDIRMIYMKKDWREEQVRIVEAGETRVAVLEHRGDPALIGDSVRRFIGWRKQAGVPKTASVFNIFYDDESNTAPEDFRVDICVATSRDVAPNDEGVIVKVIPGGRRAVLRHVGSEESFDDAIHHLYSNWQPESGGTARLPALLPARRLFPQCRRA
jgi:AraC family transcriptional regulator